MLNLFKKHPSGAVNGRVRFVVALLSFMDSLPRNVLARLCGF
jgi:hypothetical protein